MRQRLTAHTLLGVDTADGWRLPRFQFTDNGVVRGLDRVLPLLPGDVHPLVAARFLATPAGDLLLDSEAVGPSRWLNSGGDIEPVVALAADLHRVL